MKKKIKQQLQDFMKDESGKISKDKIMKVGLGTIAALGILDSVTSNVFADHQDHLSSPSVEDPVEGCAPTVYNEHVSHSSHSNY